MRLQAAKPFWLVLLATALFAGRPFAELIHYLTVPHGFCAAHAALEHGHDSRHAETHADAEGPAWQGASDHGHDTCEWLATFRERTLVSSASVERIEFPEEKTDRFPVLALTVDHEPLYRLAPKTSPPFAL